MAKASTQKYIRAEFNLVRAECISAYSGVESAMTILLKDLIGCDHKVANLLFSKMVNTRSRNEILSELIKIKTGTKYSKFTKSLFKELNQLDVVRNKIVHWRVWTGIITEGDYENIHAYLQHPNKAKPATTERLYLNDLFNFHRTSAAVEQCFISLAWDYGAPLVMKDESWTQIFLEPLPRPIPKSHPALYNYRAPEGLP